MAVATGTDENEPVALRVGDKAGSRRHIDRLANNRRRTTSATWRFDDDVVPHAARALVCDGSTPVLDDVSRFAVFAGVATAGASCARIDFSADGADVGPG